MFLNADVVQWYSLAMLLLRLMKLVLWQTFVGDKINAGIYVLEPRVLDRIELRPTSIEKETFPLIVRDKRLFAFTLPGYWMDVGQPKDYLSGVGSPPCCLLLWRYRALVPAKRPSSFKMQSCRTCCCCCCCQ